MSERLSNTPQKVADAIINLAYRPLGIRRERQSDKIEYTYKDFNGNLKTDIVDSKKTP